MYYFCPVKWSWEFPFVSATMPHSTIADHAGTEEMAGLLVTLPFLWLALAVPLTWRDRAERESRQVRTMFGAVGGLYAGVGIFLLAFFSTTERYLAEFAPALGLLAAGGWLGLERRVAHRRGRWLVNVAVVVLVTVTITMAALMSFDYHGRSLSRDDPKTWARLETTAHAALSWVGFWLGQFDGPIILKVRFVARPAGTVETFWRATDARADERVVVEHVGEREIRFGYARGTAPVKWGRRLTWEPGHTHTIELQLPSLYAAPHGVMRAVRFGEEYRERSCAALWFSGGQALGEWVAPLPTDFAAGGAPGADFSGEARTSGSRLARDDTVSTVTTATGTSGGTLRLRVVFAAPLAAQGEPLFAAGALYGSDIVWVRPLAGGAVQFVFDHFNTAPLVSAPLRLAGGDHTIEITLPSGVAGEAFGGAATGEVRVQLDGADVIRGRSACFAFAPGDEAIGRNPFGSGGTRTFRGWLLEAQWTGAAIP